MLLRLALWASILPAVGVGSVVSHTATVVGSAVSQILLACVGSAWFILEATAVSAGESVPTSKDFICQDDIPETPAAQLMLLFQAFPYIVTLSQ